MLTEERREVLFDRVAELVHRLVRRCRLAGRVRFSRDDRGAAPGGSASVRRPRVGRRRGADRRELGLRWHGQHGQGRAGDAYCLSIAAASILAKVTRQAMRSIAPNYPHYEFQDNKGYPCWRHKMALQAYGPCAIHRRTWVFMDHLSWDMRLRRYLSQEGAGRAGRAHGRCPGRGRRVIIDVQGLRKSYGEIEALRGVDFSVPEGKVLGVLGPNGAGKTTAVRILTTLLQPSGGRATVCGFDVVRQAAAVRRVIGLAGQATAITPDLTGYENLEMAVAFTIWARRHPADSTTSCCSVSTSRRLPNGRPRRTRGGCCDAWTWLRA